MECYICFEKISSVDGTEGSKELHAQKEPSVPLCSQQEHICSCKGSIALHRECFEKLLDSGYEFCSICGDRYKNIDPPLVWKKEKRPLNLRTEGSKILLGQIYLAEVVIRKNGKKSMYKIDKLGRIQGECNVYYIEGLRPSGTNSLTCGLSPFTKSYYVDGKLEGKYIEYFKSSEEPAGTEDSKAPAVLMESYFKNGVPNGLCRFYYKPWTTSSQEDHIYGSLKTSSQEDHKYGPLCEECFYVDGVMEGLCQSFWNPLDLLGPNAKPLESSVLKIPKLREKKFYKAGKLNGKAQEFDKLGRIIAEGLYENDVKKGVWKSYAYH
jgi:antitoxin component YwqK of YwqJK toxin-antitoxin module